MAYANSMTMLISGHDSSFNNSNNNAKLVIEQGAEAREKAHIEKCKKKRSFIISMKKSFVLGDYRLILPREHGENFLKDFKDNPVYLFDGRRGWEVLVKNTNRQFRFGKGWRKFVKDNGLQMNDLCHFRLAEVGNIYVVKIFKA